MNTIKLSTIFIVFILVVFYGCSNEPKSTKSQNECSTPAKKLTGERKNLNISIFLDLSDRISPTFNSNPSMEYWKRDLGYIKSITEAFEIHLRNKKTVLINDNIKLFFKPLPDNIENIDNIVKEFDKNFTKDNATLENICSISSKYSALLEKIYSTTLDQKEPDAKKSIDNYPGSDIYGYFKSNVKDYCIKPNHRNILFILTDGYMYWSGTNNKNSENKSNYILSKELDKWGFNAKNYSTKISNEKYGFQVPVTDLDNLEVFVIGLAPKRNWELDVLNSYWSNWLKAMGIRNFQNDNWNSYLKQADLPSEMDNLIQNFIHN